MKNAKLLLAAALASASGFVPADAKAPPPALSSGWAVVDSSGTLLRGETAQSVTHNATGTYVVDFAHTVKNCAYTASVGDGSSGTPPPGYVTIAGANGDVQGVYVAVFDRHGHAADIGFHLNVRC